MAQSRFPSSCPFFKILYLRSFFFFLQLSICLKYLKQCRGKSGIRAVFKNRSDSEQLACSNEQKVTKNLIDKVT